MPTGRVIKNVSARPLALPTNTAQALEILRKKFNLPALAVTVVRDGKICDRAAVGVRKLGDRTPVTILDRFQIGSCTKSMTATHAAMLIEEGKLCWSTTIAEVFPELKGKMDKQYEIATVEQLLAQRGGIPSELPANALKIAWDQNGTPTEQRYEYMKALLARPPEVAPGTKLIYSNQSYTVVGAMLEKIVGKPWEELITEKLFKPLHMDSACFGSLGATGGVDQPWGHTPESLPKQSDYLPAMAADCGVHCSLSDLARYTIFQMEGEQRDGLLKAETFRKLHAPSDGDNYACGWMCAKRDWAGGNVLWHNGANSFWYVLMLLALKRDFSVIAATNISGDVARPGCVEVSYAMIKKWLTN